MPQLPKSAALHRLTGTYRADRHAAQPVENPLEPSPPPSLSAEQRLAWSELVDIGTGLLAQSDRLAVELAARLVAKMRSPDGMTAAETAQLSALLHRLGLTSAGRRAIDRVKDADKGNPFDEF